MATFDDLRRQVNENITRAYRLPPYMLKPDPRLADGSLARACRAYDQAFTAALTARLSDLDPWREG